MLDKFAVFFLLIISISVKAQRLTVVNEKFDDNRFVWSIKTDISAADSFSYFIDKGVMHVHNKYIGSTGLRWMQRSFGMNKTANTSVKASIGLLQGRETRGFGIIINPYDGNNYLSFLFTANGNYSISSAIAGKLTGITNGWVQSSLLKKGIGQQNVIQVDKVGDIYSFTINDVVVLKQTIVGQPFKEVVGLAAYSEMHIAVDELEIKQWTSTSEIPGKIESGFTSAVDFPIAAKPTATTDKKPMQYYLVKNNKYQYGLKDGDGYRLFDPVFTAMNYYNGFASMELAGAGTTGIMNQQFQLITPFLLKNFNYFSENGYAVCIASNGFYGLIDKTGKTILPFLYQFLGSESEGLIYAMLNGKFGVINLQGNEVIPFGTIGDIDKGEFMRLGSNFRKGFMIARDPVGNKTGVINAQAKWVVEPKYAEITYVDTNRTFIVAIPLSSKKYDYLYGLLDVNGKELIAPKYDYLSEFGNNFQFRIGKEEPIDYTSDPLNNLLASTARIKKPKLYGLIDKTGKQLIPATYNNITLTTEKDIIEVSKKITDDQGKDMGEKKGLINLKGQELVPLMKYDPFKYDNTRIAGIPPEDNRLKFPYYTEGLLNVSLNSKWGVVNKTDKIIIPFEYDFISSFRDGYAVAKKDGAVFYLDKTGKKVNASSIYYPIYGAVKELPPIRK